MWIRKKPELVAQAVEEVDRSGAFYRGVGHVGADHEIAQVVVVEVGRPGHAGSEVASIESFDEHIGVCDVQAAGHRSVEQVSRAGLGVVASVGRRADQQVVDAVTIHVTPGSQRGSQLDPFASGDGGGVRQAAVGSRSVDDVDDAGLGGRAVVQRSADDQVTVAIVVDVQVA